MCISTKILLILKKKHINLDNKFCKATEVCSKNLFTK